MKSILALVFLLISATANAQGIQQSGVITPGHIPTWVIPNVVKDSGPATNGALTELGITKNGGLPFCIVTGPPTSAAYDQLCMGVSLNGSGFISLTPYGTATPIPLNLIINGTTYSIGGTNWLSGILDQQFGSTPGDILCRSSASWVALPPGTSGQLLQTLGSSACPAWTSSGALVGPAFRKITSATTDTATSVDGTVAWANSSNALKTQNIYACNSAVAGRTLTIKDEQGNSFIGQISIIPASGTIDNFSSIFIGNALGSVTLQCDGGSNWVVI